MKVWIWILIIVVVAIVAFAIGKNASKCPCANGKTTANKPVETQKSPSVGVGMNVAASQAG